MSMCAQFPSSSRIQHYINIGTISLSSLGSRNLPRDMHTQYSAENPTNAIMTPGALQSAQDMSKNFAIPARAAHGSDEQINSLADSNPNAASNVVFSFEVRNRKKGNK